jgi:hypothetical protein
VNESFGNTAANRTIWDSWRDEVRSIGFTNPLTNYDFDAFGQIDLDRAHPGGMAQFTSTGATVLSNLVRDPLNFSSAHAAAKRIDAKAHQLREQFGLETCYLAAGVIGLEADGFDLRMPVLLWPISLVKTGDDYDVKQHGFPIVNPALASNLEVCYGIRLDEAALLATVKPKGELVPIALLESLANQVGSSAKAEIRSILALGNFTTAPTLMLAELDDLDTPLLNRILGLENPEPAVDISHLVVQPVADADAAQRRIVARAVAGHSFAVETLPGCGYTQTVVNTVAALTQAGKRTLILAPRRQTLQEISDRFASLNLNGLVARSEAVWLDTIAAISRNERSASASGAIQPDSGAAKRLASAQARLAEYFDGLRSKDPVLGVSITDVLEKLAQLAAMPHAPETSARINRTQLLNKTNREAALDLLAKACELGEFRFGPQDSAWFQARFDNPADVANTLQIVGRLRDETFPSLVAKLNEFIAAVEFRPANTVSEIGEYLKLFAGIRESLDRFLPSIYDRSLEDMILATGQRVGRGDMSGGTRRRLKKLAKEFIRPGMHVADLNASLRAIEEQRLGWAKHCIGLKPPAVPGGINDALVTHQALVVDLERIQRHLDPRSTDSALVNLPLEALGAKLNSMVEDTGALENLGERAMVANELRQLGLEDLMRDLARLHVTREHLASEFDLAWWQSSLELLAEQTPQVLNVTPEALQALEQEFAEAQLAVLEENRANLAGRLGAAWHSALASVPQEAANLKTVLKTGSATFAQLAAAAPSIVATALPNLAMSPYEVAALLPTDARFDAVLLLDAAGTSIAENLGGLIRANQVITFGDDAIAVPTGFEVEAKPTSLKRGGLVASVQSVVTEAFGSEVLRRSYRTSGQILGAFINREFYQNRIVFEPSADDYWGTTHVDVDLIREGANAPSLIAGANQSLDAEVAKSLEVIYNHALWHPEDSLLFVTASAMHADRVRTAVYAGLKQRHNLLEFFEGHGRERFEVSTLANLSHRVADHVIFSLGFGKSPRGAFIGELGDLTAQDGKRQLANLLVSARKQLTVVSCLAATDLPTDATDGVAHLRDLLQAGVRVEQNLADNDSDPLLHDLAVRLRKLGVTVKTDFGNELTMVASYGNRAIELQPDWVVADRDLAQELYLRPRLLRALGWGVRRIHALDLFANPDGTAKGIAGELGMQIGSQSSYEDAPKFEDTDAAWGDYNRSAGAAGANDDRLKRDVPPHWA